MKENAQWRMLSDEEMRLVVGGSTMGGGDFAQQNLVQSIQEASAVGGLVNTAVNVTVAPQINVIIGKF